MTTRTVLPPPGIYPDIPFEEYFAWPYVNATSVVAGVRSMAHMKTQLRSPPPPTDLMRQGIFNHMGQLETVKLPSRYVVMPDFENDDDNVTQAGDRPKNPKLTGYYKRKVAEFQAVNITKEIVSQDWYDTMVSMVAAIKAHPKANAYLNGPGLNEVSIVWDDPETKIRCRCRIDKVDRNLQQIPDLKGTKDASRFEQTLYRFGYHIKAAMYEDGWASASGKRYQSCLVAVETEPPYGVRAAPMGRAAIDLGRRTYKRILAAYKQCAASGEWPSYPDVPEWTLPAYVIDNEKNYGLIITEEAAA